MSRRLFMITVLLLAFPTQILFAEELAARNPRVLFITEKNCQRCTEELLRLNKPRGEFETMRSIGWKIGETAENHIQIVDRESIPELTELLGAREYPAVVCIEGDEIVRSFKSGCTTPLDAWTFGFLLKGKNERPPGAVLEAARVKTTGHYPLRGNHWTVEGDDHPTVQKLVAHLRGPNHGHQIPASDAIETWSYEELRSLHDDLHEREMANGGGFAAAGTKAYGSQSATGSNYLRGGHKAGSR